MKEMKKTLTVLLASIMVFLSISASVNANGFDDKLDSEREGELQLPVSARKDGDLTWNIDNLGHLTISGNGDYLNADWKEYHSLITSVEVHVSGITNAGYMFDNLDQATVIDVSDLDTSSVSDMCHMFYHCEKVQELDLDGFQTSKVTDMRQMFEGCSSLQSLSLAGFDTKNVEDRKSVV